MDKPPFGSRASIPLIWHQPYMSPTFLSSFSLLTCPSNTGLRLLRTLYGTKQDIRYTSVTFQIYTGFNCFPFTYPLLGDSGWLIFLPDWSLWKRRLQISFRLNLYLHKRIRDLQDKVSTSKEKSTSKSQLGSGPSLVRSLTGTPMSRCLVNVTVPLTTCPRIQLD